MNEPIITQEVAKQFTNRVKSGDDLLGATDAELRLYARLLCTAIMNVDMQEHQIHQAGELVRLALQLRHLDAIERRGRTTSRLSILLAVIAASIGAIQIYITLYPAK